MMAERMWGDELRFGAGDEVPPLAMLLKSRRWWRPEGSAEQGKRNAIRCAANDMEFVIRNCHANSL